MPPRAEIPARSASTRASAIASLITAMMAFTASFIAAPVPAAPRWNLLIESAARTGSARSIAPGSPPIISVNSPFSASAVLPDTGASIQCAPRSPVAVANSMAAVGPIVLRSTRIEPSPRPASTPSFPCRIAPSASASATIVMTTSDCWASALESRPRPLPATSAARSARSFGSTRSAGSRRRALCAPAACPFGRGRRSRRSGPQAPHVVEVSRSFDSSRDTR